MSEFEAVIGLEIHAQLKTESKIFSSASTDGREGDNHNVSEVCAGLPGTLPRMNQKAVELAIKGGLALGCKINSLSVFSRKQYFYPDLPKGYQLSQYDLPVCGEGSIEFTMNGERKKINIERAHLEEDAGKSTHFGTYTLVNLNRAGVPLLEIVSRPELRSAAEAAEYVRTVRRNLQYADVCDGNLEEGSMRCDCNVSIRKKGEKKLGTRVELKNINSFRFIEKAIDYEINRQIASVELGEAIVQETRLYDSDKNKTVSMRSKEDVADYRYFPDPDLLPLVIKEEQIERLRDTLPELPLQRYGRLRASFGIDEQEAMFLIDEKSIADFFEDVVAVSGEPKLSSNWIKSELFALLNQHKLSISESRVSSSSLGQLVLAIKQGQVSGKMAKDALSYMWSNQVDANRAISDLGLQLVSNEEELGVYVDKMIAQFPDQVAEYRGGKQKMFGFFVGQIMKQTKGQAEPQLLQKLLLEKLK